eukprot:200354_1
MTFDYKRQMECYPSAKYTPYWLVLLGIVASSIIINWVVLYGNFFVAQFITKIKIICNCYKIHNNFKTFPKAITISYPNPEQSTRNEIIAVCGCYRINNDNNCLIPNYIHDESGHFCLRFIDDPSSKFCYRWVIDNIKNDIGYVMIQSEAANKLLMVKKRSLSINMPLVTETTEKQSCALNCLNMKKQFWTNNVSHKLGFNKTIGKSEMDFSIIHDTVNDGHNCIILDGFNDHFSNGEDGATFFNVNGKYIYTKEDNDEKHKLFIHEHDKLLSMRYIEENDTFLHYASGYNINYDRYGYCSYIPLHKSYVVLKSFHETLQVS